MKGSEKVGVGGQMLEGPCGVREYGRQDKKESFILNPCYLYIVNHISNIWKMLSIEGMQYTNIWFC